MNRRSPGAKLMVLFFAGLLFLSAGTLMYEVVLTRLLSVICWYYLAFVSISMAMFGMTAGALAVQLLPKYFGEESIALRLYQSVMAMAISMPLALLIMLAIPLAVSLAVQTLVVFIIFATVISVPFFFSGIAVCIALTRMPFAMGRIYSVDLAGAALGCLGAVVLLNMIDAPSAIFEISALLFVSAAAFADYAGERKSQGRCLAAAVAMVVVAGLNSLTAHGIQPIWAKGFGDARRDIYAELWNPISKVRFSHSGMRAPMFHGPSVRMPKLDKIDAVNIDIDNDAATQMARFNGDLDTVKYLRYDVTSVAPSLRRGGTAAVIGVGGGRDVLNCARNGFTRIVGIEINSIIANLPTHDLGWYSGFSKIRGFELHNDDGRSYLTRTGEHFDLIQASLVDTWAATSAGAMTLSENALYTVDGWRVFYEHLKPGGIVTFSRWYAGAEKSQTYRLFSVAYATLLSEGVTDPASHLALIQNGSDDGSHASNLPFGASVATLMVSNEPFTAADIAALRAIDDELAFAPIYMPDTGTNVPELKKILQLKTVGEMAGLEDKVGFNYSPTTDNSPYFFNAIHVLQLPKYIASGANGSNLQATVFLFAFMLAAAILVMATIGLPAWLTYRKRGDTTPAPIGGVLYFTGIGLGFMCVEMGMMQQLSVFLGHPVYALVVVLAGLILSTGLGSLVSDRWPVKAAWQCRVPAVASAVLIVIYSIVVLPVMHANVAGTLWQRALICLLLIGPPGFVLGFCFPVGLRWMTELKQRRNLPWMWALNGAAGTLGSFVAMLVSMETSIGACVLTGCALYLLAGLALPMRAARVALPEMEQAVEHAS